MKSHLACLLLIHTLNGQIIWITCSLLFTPKIFSRQKQFCSAGKFPPRPYFGKTETVVTVQQGETAFFNCQVFNLATRTVSFHLITIFIDQSPCSSHSQGKVINCNGSTEFVFATVPPPNQLNLNLIIVTFFLYILKTLS